MVYGTHTRNSTYANEFLLQYGELHPLLIAAHGESGGDTHVTATAKALPAAPVERQGGCA